MNGGYSALLLLGIGVTLWWWSRLARRDERLLYIYVAALVGAFVGAKLVYLAAEGWMFWDSPDRWRIWATGKTILGALLGGYASVEMAKKALGYRAATGDFFALVAPVGIVLGRVGCLLHGCRSAANARRALVDIARCARHGAPAAVPVEIAFNGDAGALLLPSWRTSARPALSPLPHRYGLFASRADIFALLAIGCRHGYKAAALRVALAFGLYAPLAGGESRRRLTTDRGLRHPTARRARAGRRGDGKTNCRSRGGVRKPAIHAGHAR